MAKMKVHELAKELEIESKVIVEFLKGTEYEVKAAQSSVEDAAQDNGVPSISNYKDYEKNRDKRLKKE